MAGTIRIGEILVRAGVIDQHQLNAALGEQRRWGKPLGATLVKLGFVEERELVRGLASQLALPVASLEGKRIAPQIVALVPQQMAQEHMVLPLFAKQTGNRTTLFLAMEDPGDLAVLDDLAFRTGMQVKPVMMSPSEICEGIDRYYRVEEKPASEAVEPVSADDPAVLGALALVRMQHEAGTKAPLADAASVPAPKRECDDASAGTGTEELVRHFMSGVADSAPRAEQPASPIDPVPVPADTLETTAVNYDAPARRSAPTAAPTTAPTTAPAAAPATAPTRSERASDAVLEEAHLAAPPPRKALAEGEEALTHPPMESLASYDAKTRTILHVLTQLLIEKGVINREEFHARVSALADVGSEKN